MCPINFLEECSTFDTWMFLVSCSKTCVWGNGFECRHGNISTHRYSKTEILKDWVMRDLDCGWTHIVKSKEVRVGKLRGILRSDGKFVLGKLLRCLAILIVKRWLSETRRHEMIEAATKSKPTYQNHAARASHKECVIYAATLRLPREAVSVLLLNTGLIMALNS